MTAAMRMTWAPDGRGWATCTVENRRARAELTASYITSAPEDLLTALARLTVGGTETRTQFDAEPAAYRWIFSRDGEDSRVRVLELRHGSGHDNEGTEIWSAQLLVDALVRAVIRCFDEVARSYGETGYHSAWGRPFPRRELESLRRLWRARRGPTCGGAMSRAGGSRSG